jgi:hypothetical protein
LAKLAFVEKRHHPRQQKPMRSGALAGWFAQPAVASNLNLIVFLVVE